MANLIDINAGPISKGLKFLPAKMDTPNARRMLLAIGLQESGFATTVQYGGGPAHSFWQFEQGGGVKGVLTHPASKQLAADACAAWGIDPTPKSLWIAMGKPEYQDLAAVMARLLLWTDAHPMPVNAADGWDYYKRNWRPGKPHPDKFPACWASASAALGLTA